MENVDCVRGAGFLVRHVTGAKEGSKSLFCRFVPELCLLFKHLLSSLKINETEPVGDMDFRVALVDESIPLACKQRNFSRLVQGLR